ncbi:MAG: heat-inducible transcription repressor HrcA, partial [Sorangium cellulosum]
IETHTKCTSLTFLGNQARRKEIIFRQPPDSPRPIDVAGRCTQNEQTMSELSERSRRVLHAVVTEFIASGEPVGSRTLSRKYGLEVCPATIRNVMVDLEESGYLYQPHTSAGRLPTEQAFRIYVDSLMTVDHLSGDEEAEIHALDDISPGMALLRESSRVLSRLAGTASVIVAPQTDRRRLRELHFVVPTSASGTLLAVLLFTDGSVESRVVDVQEVPSEADLERMHNLLAEDVQGKTLQQVRETLAVMLDQERVVLDRLTKRAYEIGILVASDETSEDRVVVVEGQSRLICQPDFGDVQLLREMMQTLEDREQLILLLDRTIIASSLQVLVGN